MKNLLDKLRFFKNDYINHAVISVVLYVTIRLIIGFIFGGGLGSAFATLVCMLLLTGGLETAQAYFNFGEAKFMDFLAGFVAALAAFIIETTLIFPV